MTARKRSWYPLAGSTVAGTKRGAAPRASRAVARGPVPIDPLSSPRLAISGRVVTMNDAFDVIEDGVVYMADGCIAAVRRKRDKAPDGFEGVAVVATRGTLYPGLIELHNHLSYNALPLWSPVPKLYEHRGQWPQHPDYRKLISGPMTVIGQHRDAQGQAALLAPLVRYVECKCLLGGVTTSQGIMLNSNAGVQRYYRGILRNVENTDDPALSEAQARIADVDARDARAFLARLNKEDSCFLLHLSEGVTPTGATTSQARKHFLALEVAPGEWAINDRLAAIHSAGLTADDFRVLGDNGGSMIWSPLSNLLLYGATARVDAARAANVRIGIGSDWSPSGSKNLLGELKVAWLYSKHLLDGAFSARDLVAMATRDAAAILKWEGALGSLEAGKRADLLVVGGTAGDPYEALVKARETSINLVMINGIARYGLPATMKALGASGESFKVGGKTRTLFLEQATGDPDVAKLSLSAARTALKNAFRQLPDLARAIEEPPAMPAARAARPAIDAPQPLVWTLALDEIANTGMDQRPRLPFDGPRDFTGPSMQPASLGAPRLSSILAAVELDPLTVADDRNFLARIAAEPNVPQAIRKGLASLY
ncbi:amidohydrolase family protein [Variovorax sp. J22P168]|uniref:amidohydrolase family protein n=1 Tax=Variovorax jilinensis TaxID=3053513 RepID=UPI002576E769|nr:amidohydrolase family protein [Variovorax sp. J22P168]MDM0015034.1 amidohydrolase family protein [Variovorax sp. J22P168]